MNQSGHQYYYEAFHLGHSLGGSAQSSGRRVWRHLAGAWAVHLQVLMTQAQGE